MAFLFFLVHIVLIKCLAFPLMNRPEKEAALSASQERQEEAEFSSAVSDKGPEVSETLELTYVRDEETLDAEDFERLGTNSDGHGFSGGAVQTESSVGPRNTFQASGESVAELFPFDPNRADSMTFVRLGIPLRVVRNILNYRRKGGTFRQADDLAKIYGMEADVFERLKPYVRMTKPSLDLNRADSLQLTALRGIGAYTAHKILVYRRQLGGFYSLDQLGEVPDVRSDNLKELREVARLDLSALQKLDLASAGVGELRRHPYLDFYQARAIVDFRARQHRPPDYADLEMLEEFNADDLKRLRPYLP